MLSPNPDAMTREEKRAGASLAAIYALRMLGLFLIYPVFVIHARTLPGGNDLTLVGMALGAYGLTQAIFQVPFGMASDAFGRKRIIILGLLIFAFGSVVAALATDVWGMLLGRILQGAGAISAAVTALAADLTREQHRTKIMAIIGSTIGLMFAVSLVGAPILYGWIGMAGIFWLIGVLALAAIGLVIWVVPEPPPPHAGPKVPLIEILSNTGLLRLNLGIFVLHMAQLGMFVVVPMLIANWLPPAKHWQVYLPALLGSFVFVVPAIVLAEKYNRVRLVFLMSISLLALTMLGLWLGLDSFVAVAAGLLSFFVAFNVLEAMLPSLVSRVAPARARGTALGVYNTMQALGAALGPSLGGWMAKHFGIGTVFIAAGAITLVWLAAAATMAPVPLRRGASAQTSHGILDN